MSIVKSFSVGDGDMFYINHNSESLTIIDCCLTNENYTEILSELKAVARVTKVQRFISTHPDDDHIRGLAFLYGKIDLPNFYCVRNKVFKFPQSSDFMFYRKLRDSYENTHYLSRNCPRRWLNLRENQISSTGISILWPDTSNIYFQNELNSTTFGSRPNNLSPIILYESKEGAKVVWMGDLETTFMNKILNDVSLPAVDILFAAHHGRDSGKIPLKWLESMKPKMIVIGEASSQHLNYYDGYNTITQKSTGNITFDIRHNRVHVLVSKPNYYRNFLHSDNVYRLFFTQPYSNENYVGSLSIPARFPNFNSLFFGSKLKKNY